MELDVAEARGVMAEVQGRLRDVRVLVVEDVAESRHIVAFFLKKAGALVETAEDGREGLDKVTAGSFDAVLMDLEMPEANGYATLVMLREMQFTKPVVALTAHESIDERRRCQYAGFNGYLTKPINPSDLVDIVAGLTSTPAPEVSRLGTRQMDEAPAYKCSSTLANAYQSFLNRLPGRSDELRRAWREAHWEKAEKIAHQLKGTAGCCGFTGIMDVMCAIEDELRAEKNLPRLECFFERLTLAGQDASRLF